MSLKLSREYLQKHYPDYKKDGILPADIMEMIMLYLCELKRGYKDGTTYEIPFLYGKKHGVEREWYPTGEIFYEISWENGLEHGPEKWYENGQLKTETSWVNGQKHGLSKWYEKGELILIQKWDKNSLEYEGSGKALLRCVTR